MKFSQDLYRMVRAEIASPAVVEAAARVTCTRVGDSTEFFLDGEFLGSSSITRDGWIVTGQIGDGYWLSRVHRDGVPTWLAANRSLGGIPR